MLRKDRIGSTNGLKPKTKSAKLVRSKPVRDPISAETYLFLSERTSCPAPKLTKMRRGAAIVDARRMSLLSFGENFI